ncbi:MAG TPA: hypothetical protein VN957_16920, partial [Chthoniobacterales bacterium]|nr:hypothetical protein [Chthoniobacterales bacterium]
APRHRMTLHSVPVSHKTSTPELLRRDFDKISYGMRRKRVVVRRQCPLGKCIPPNAITALPIDLAALRRRVDSSSRALFLTQPMFA